MDEMGFVKIFFYILDALVDEGVFIIFN